MGDDVVGMAYGSFCVVRFEWLGNRCQVVLGVQDWCLISDLGSSLWGSGDLLCEGLKCKGA